MRSKWTDINLDECDYLIARVEALVNYVEKLREENAGLRNRNERLERLFGAVAGVDRGEVGSYPLPSVLVRGLPVPQGGVYLSDSRAPSSELDM